MVIKKKNNIKYYTPDESLVKYLNEKLHIVKNHEKLENTGEKLSENTIKEIKNNDRMKTHILDKIVFQSMIDITYFLQFVVSHKELQKIFENDLKDLFTLRIKDLKENKRGFIFEYLLAASTEWDEFPRNNDDKYSFTSFLYNSILNSIVYGLQHRIQYQFRAREKQNSDLENF